MINHFNEGSVLAQILFQSNQHFHEKIKNRNLLKKNFVVCNNDWRIIKILGFLLIWEVKSWILRSHQKKKLKIVLIKIYTPTKIHNFIERFEIKLPNLNAFLIAGLMRSNLQTLWEIINDAPQC
jgi:hypothetical protein